MLGLFRKSIPLVSSDPKDLNLEKLLHLQNALIAKLVLVNCEITARYGKILNNSTGIDDSQKHREVLAQAAEDINQFTGLLQAELNKRVTIKT